MKFKNLCPEEILSLSFSLTMFLIEKFDNDNLITIKNILCAITNNLSTYQTQQIICDKKNKK
ncbi:MAG: hypothetical protein E7359_00345 [Clostridiales bacterium]|nr:hypothetical protein [Clostridiales bacterium]